VTLLAQAGGEKFNIRPIKILPAGGSPMSPAWLSPMSVHAPPSSTRVVERIGS